MELSNPLDSYLPERIRNQIAQRYLVRINERARMDRVIHDPNFYDNPHSYPPFFADHGVVHHLDVARRILEVLETAHGLLIPAREENRLEFMKGYGVILACVHDIGMVDFSPMGRVMHPPVASQTIFSPEFKDLLMMVWDENCGNLAWRLTRLVASGALEADPTSVLREMLAMVNCHSKSNVPIATLNDVQELRRLMQRHLSTPVHQLYYTRQIEKARREVQAAQEEQDRAALDRSLKAINALENMQTENEETAGPSQECLRVIDEDYTDFQLESYAWLVSEHPETRLFAMDIIDTLRALRCADALRQRGSVLKTSGGYEVFVDHQSAKAVMGLRLGENELYLLEIGEPLSAGEANIAASQLDADGNLRVSFQRGAFSDGKATQAAANQAALAVNDIQADVIDSFLRPAPPPDGRPENLKPAAEMQILLESPDDNLEFADNVRAALGKLNPRAATITRCVPSLNDAAAIELERYLQAEGVDWDLPTRQEILQLIARSGHKTDSIDPTQGFENVKLIHLESGDRLVEAGGASTFVYVPLSQGLRVIPLGGYASFPVQAWMPLGITGVIRGAERNATILAEQPVSLLMIPKSVYMHFWHRAHNVTELTGLFQARTAAAQEKNESTLSRIEKAMILKNVSLFAEIPIATLAELAEFVAELKFNPGETVFEKGDIGDSLYVIAAGRVRVHEGEQTLNHLGSNEVFGEMALLDPETRMASVTTVAETRLLLLDQVRFQNLLTQYPQVALSIMQILTRRLRARARELVEMKSSKGKPEAPGGKPPSTDT